MKHPLRRTLVRLDYILSKANERREERQKRKIFYNTSYAINKKLHLIQNKKYCN